MFWHECNCNLILYRDAQPWCSRLFQFRPWKLSAGRNLQASKMSRKDWKLLPRCVTIMSSPLAATPFNLVTDRDLHVAAWHRIQNRTSLSAPTQPPHELQQRHVEHFSFFNLSCNSLSSKIYTYFSTHQTLVVTIFLHLWGDQLTSETGHFVYRDLLGHNKLLVPNALLTPHSDHQQGEFLWCDAKVQDDHLCDPAHMQVSIVEKHWNEQLAGCPFQDHGISTSTWHHWTALSTLNLPLYSIQEDGHIATH